MQAGKVCASFKARHQDGQFHGAKKNEKRPKPLFQVILKH
jgi:hypothetical protein